jgi:hypothetical protein
MDFNQGNQGLISTIEPTLGLVAVFPGKIPFLLYSTKSLIIRGTFEPLLTFLLNGNPVIRMDICTDGLPKA